ncbi:hypothetical protein [Agrobacterium sp. 10MFCol1.1]|uniref:hypothetical protein n=1 Tax=Agrobacterium sp. 10MFCol1.1 TaxID=1150775 RepID=UPI00036E2A55|nr:hypothetical protein [Agrobacterium sp. 10MFCol1.1]
MDVKETGKNQIGKGKAGPGRPKGIPNKTTTLIKDAIIQAATNAGDGDMVEYLTQQARLNPGPFMALLGKVLPTQIAGDEDNPIKTITEIRLVGG